MPPNASSSWRWPFGLSRPRSSCWPWISTLTAAMSRNTAADTGVPQAKARLPPSDFSVRRSSSGSPGSASMPCSASSACTEWPAGMSSSADTAAVFSPLRTRPASARAPSARPSASSRIDLPAPVSPVSTPRPGSNSSSSLSTNTTSLMASCLSIGPSTLQPALALRRSALNAFRLFEIDQPVSAVIPDAVRIIRAEDDRGLASLDRDAEREIAFDQPVKRLGRVAGGRIFLDDVAEPGGRGEPVARPLVEAADLHFLAGEMVVDQVELQPRVGGIAALGITADKLAERV